MTKRKEYLALAAIVAVFAIWKLLSLHLRFGDENVYFYMTHAILGGSLPYRDFFLADPPVFVFLLSLWKALIGKHLLLFKVWPVLLDSASAVIIYLLLKRRGFTLALLGPLFYLFSFTLLSTSDYVTGSELMIFFILAALYTDEREKPLWSGVLWSLSCLVKLYAAPALIGFLLYKVYKRDWSNLKRIILGGVITTLVVLAPFAILAPHNLLYDLITHQFRRPAGINKWSVLSLFGQMEWTLIILGAVGALITKRKSLSLALVVSLIFLLLYRDLYYLYLQILMPFLVLLAVETVETVRHKFGNELCWALLLLYFLCALYPITAYVSGIAPDGIFDNASAVSEALENAPQTYPIYGIQEVAPLVALMSGKPIFDNVIDTNTQNFAAGTHDRLKISKAAVQNGIYLVTHGAPDLYFDPDLFKSNCLPYKTFDNDIAIYTCHY